MAIFSHDDIQSTKANTASTRQTMPAESHNTGNPFPEITRIALEIGGRGTPVSETDTSPIANIGDFALNPRSSTFDARKWVEDVLTSANDNAWKFRRTSIIFKNFDMLGSRSTEQSAQDVISLFLKPFQLHGLWRKNSPRRVLHQLDGLVQPGEMLLVLGRPGSGCSSLLKAIGGEINGLCMGQNASLHYNGIPQKEMSRNFKGETVYNAEADTHFAHLTVKQTLDFAACLRMPRNRLVGESRKEHVEQMTAVAMAMTGLAHVQDTKVGSDYVRGVSGGERKRVSIAEMVLARAAVGCWDNSTRGLDSATALKFVSHLKVTSDLLGTVHVAALYQASEAIYNLFNKVLVLYEGREIYFGSIARARFYFEDLGWICEPHQSTPDFLTVVTNPSERKARPRFQDRVPRSPDEFEQAWHSSREYKTLQDEISGVEEDLSRTSADSTFRTARRVAKARFLLSRSPYTVSLQAQFRACLQRAYHRSWNDKTPILTMLVGQVIMALVVGSLFYNIPSNTDGFFSTGSVLFFVLLLNTVVSVIEISSLFEQRPIIQKHTSYAFCHPFIESMAVFVLDIPIKLVVATCFNITLYFLAGFQAEASTFFTFYLTAILIRFTMSSIFRTVGSITKMYYQALAIAGVLLLATLNYTGFTLLRSYMHPWFEWIIWINPLAYGFEVLMVNQFNGVDYSCSSLVPDYPDASATGFICAVPGANVGETTVSGNAYIESSFQYSYNHLWRNVGILFGFLAFFTITYLAASELNLSVSENPGAIQFLRGKRPKRTVHFDQEEVATKCISGPRQRDSESSALPTTPKHVLFSWKDITYDVKARSGSRRLLDDISGWVQSGSLTALMGVSGAGKTTLLDVLAGRLNSGLRSGNISLRGSDISRSAFENLGYVPQQDVLLETATVREALCFSALLRQGRSTMKSKKYSYVEEIIKVLGMQEFADAVIGSVESGLNMEQRKRVSIGVELAAKPHCLLFLDEPTSGLDSQSSLAIVSLLQKLANSGMAILATIHQPSAVLLRKFDRLLFLTTGGKTVYFGDIGPNSNSVVNYFEDHGSRKCGGSENPAEYFMKVLSPQAEPRGDLDWARIWSTSEEKRLQDVERDRITTNMSHAVVISPNESFRGRFEAPIHIQLLHTTMRNFQQHWRTPSYVWGKLLLGLVSSLFIGFSFYQLPNSKQGVQDVIFSIFMITAILSSLLQQIMPRFMANRSLYETREGPSMTYSWVTLVLSNMIVELPYQIVFGVVVYACYYYPVFGIQSPDRQGLVLLYCVQYFIYATSFASMISAATPDSQTAATLATLMFSMAMLFNGVFQPLAAMPGFWKFMYYVSPFTYIISGIAATGLHGEPIRCSENELSIVEPPPDRTCAEYLYNYIAQHGGEVYNPSATSGCQYCSLSTADQFLAGVGISWGMRWRNFGIMWAYVLFNCIMALLLYYAFRVRKWSVGFRK